MLIVDVLLLRGLLKAEFCSPSSFVSAWRAGGVDGLIDVYSLYRHL